MGRDPVQAGFGPGAQGGHGIAAWNIGLVQQGAQWTNNTAGFSVTRRAGGDRDIRFRSGLNSVAFTDGPADDGEIERVMAPAWVIALQNALDQAFG